MNGQILGLVSAAPMIVNDWAISVEPIDGGHRLIARRGTEEQTIDIMNGLNGMDGQNGTDGVSPTLTVTDTADGVVLTITDLNGTQTVTLPKGGSGLPEGGVPGDMLVRTEDSAEWVTPATDDDIVDALLDADLLPAVMVNGAVLRDGTGKIVLI
ncbi:MAG: hypothetical protein IJ386_08755 [Clostridia bacterium]|nr:hypothetical protein [Clostridia bacterium]